MKNQKLASYFYRFEDIRKLTLSELSDILKKQGGIKLSELRLRDLVFFGNQPIDRANGVYMFLNRKKEIAYIGKSGSRSIVERIPAHFDLRPTSWFNTFMKKLSKSNRRHELQSGAAKIFNNYSLIYILFKNNKQNKRRISALESLLQTANFETLVNSPRRKRGLSAAEKSSSIRALLK